MDFKKKLAQLGEQPDIILIITDEQRATQHFPPGWEEQHLPTLTFLKKNGFSFDRAFCNTCMCSPSRATLFTGLYPAKHMVSQTLTIGGPLSPAEPTLSPSLPNIMNVLWNEGYDVQYRGKWHMSKGVAGNGAVTNYDNLTPADIALFGAMGWISPDAGEDVNPLNFGGGFANHDARYVAEAIKYLQEVKARRAAGHHKPYCLIVSLVNPHDVLAYPNTAGTSGYHSDSWSGREIGLPDTVNEHLLANKKPMAQEQILIGMAGLLGPLATTEQKLNYINFYGYLLSWVDKEIGHLIKELYAKDSNGKSLADAAIVTFTSDHGEMGLAHGGLRQKTFVAYEEALRIPLVISNPVLFSGDQAQHSMALATLADIMPTFLEIANVSNPPTGLAGTSLLPIIEEGIPVQDSILFTYDDTKAGSNSQWSAVNAANRIRCIRTEKWKFSYYFDAAGAYYNQFELYDLVNDPSEYTNLAYDPAYREIRDDLAKQLHQLIIDKLRVRAPQETEQVQESQLDSISA
ncbi:sulfatase-like hydrolase/transferase [Chitinophaga filiformis]|uniref:sulfatase-like hydrolase/transferase n=1 Tax=Chitinophaga filiformis TaxID=104663 RepID=UPI001F2F415E|nr:sulfatase-like hydrolase/transferase [Chitinophaga filiformis]MCF6406842.1 sulfatase-like hydrolase/transferase [Chitinophaga filiformis]